MADELAPCPCGEIPEKLRVEESDLMGKWALVNGYCCGEWSVEFRAYFNPIGSEESNRLAREAWNAAPRGKNGGL